MPGEREHVDRLLREFLEAEAAHRAKGITLGAVYRAVERVTNRQIDQDQRLDRYGRRLRNLEREAERRSESEEGPDWKPDPRDVTGTHDLAVLKAQHDEMRDEAKWSRRQKWQVIGAIIGALAVAGISGCVTYAVAHVEVRK